jgi:hypothetical protein
VTRVLVASFVVVAGTELVALAAHDRRFVLWISGTAVALLLLGLRRLVGLPRHAAPSPPDAGIGAGLRHWMSHAETMIGWSESTRKDWDRHLRPILAVQFANVTGQSRRKDPAAFDATGRMLFGAELWAWVDPANAAGTGGEDPAPGRAALEEILRRLERA